MAEYIDRQEVIKKLEELDTRLMRGHYYDECEGLAMAKAIVNGVPAADVKTVVHGQWFGTVCTACGESTSFYYDCAYCPQCGAEMDEVSGDE